MTLKPTLYTRFLVWTMLLLVFLVGTIIFVIQRKEVRTIFEEARNRGILTAQYIANMNLRPLVLWDEETLLSNIESQADDKLVYIVFYDREGKPRAANRLDGELRHALTERFRRVSVGRMEIDITVDDPKVYTRPWTISMPLYRRQERNSELLEYQCNAYLLEQEWNNPASTFFEKR